MTELRDVNERLLLAGLREQAAREDAERLTAGCVAFLSQVTDGVVIVDFAGQITYVNAAAQQLDGMLHVGISLATPVDDDVPLPADQAHLCATLSAFRALRGENVLGIEGRIRRTDDIDATVRSCGIPLLSGDGQVIGALIRLQNTTAATGEAQDAAPDFQVGDLAIHYHSKLVTLKGQPVKLSPIEYQLLYRLARNAGRILPVQTLLDRIWGTTVTAYADYVKIYIHRLRAKIERQGEPRYIETVRGLGYRFMGPPSSVARHA